MFTRLSRSVTVVLLVLLALPLANVTPLYSAPGTPPGPTHSSDRVGNSAVPERWIIRLTNPPLAQAPGMIAEYATMALGNQASGRLQLDSPAAQQYRAQLLQQQNAVFSALRRSFPSAKLHRNYQVVFNGIAVALPGVANPEAKLRAIPGVAAVYKDLSYEPTMFASIPQIGADQLWASRQIGGQSRAGEGVKIAIIDSGIQHTHPFFNPDGFTYPPGFPKGEAAFTTPKVISARAYFRPDLPPLPGSETPLPGPDGSSHGTHVAGTAAGVANTTATIGGLEQTISGVAPRAYLMNYKVFYQNDSPFSGSAFTVELIAALEDAVADGADVINNSWGSRAETEPFANPLTLAAEAAVDAGVTVIFSAGNEGPNENTAGSPGYTDKVITVGAVSSPRTIASGFVDVVAPEGTPEVLRERPYGTATFGPPIEDELFGPAPYLPLSAIGLSSLACEPAPAGALAGRVALIERGVCPFSAKVYNAQLGGAIAAIIYNSEAGGEELVTMAASDYADAVTIPSISVGRSLGLGMTDWYAQHGEAALVQIDPRARVIDQSGDVITSFSSRGPTFQGTLKPDVVAPGENILSSGYGPGAGEEAHNSYGMASGTSMAAPHVTGAAALLKQIHPNWSPADIKSALMSTATTDVWLDEDKTEPAGVLDRGAGRIDLTRAANPGLLFDRQSLSFGEVVSPHYRVLAVRARNVSGTRQTYTLSGRTTVGDFGITVSPPTLTLAPGATGLFEVAINLPPGSAPIDYEGVVELQGGTGTLHLPLWARALPAERNANKVLLIDNDGSSSWGFDDYSGYYGNALGALGVPFTYLDVDALAGEEQTLPSLSELQSYDIILWFTGDNFLPNGSATVPTPLTDTDQDLLIAYLQSGGSLIATGQDLSEASDINRTPPDDPLFSRSDLYHSYLGARFVQDNVFGDMSPAERTVTGTAAQIWTADIALDLTPSNAPSDQTGASNQATVDEMTVIDIDPRTPDEYTTPIFRAASVNAREAGIVGLNRFAEPTLENPSLGIPYRTTFLSFGLEGVRNDTGTTSRLELLQRLLYWHVDRPSVTISGSAEVTQAGQEVTLTANAQSNTPTTFIRYRWDFGDGTPIFETDQATVVHQYAQPGTYQPRVEATNTWGHKAISSGVSSGQTNATAQTTNAVGSRTFAETGHTLQGRFLEYWESNGGLAVFGFPISAQGGTPTSQVFERTRLEYHPQNAAPYDVLLGRLGAEALEAQGRDWRSFPTVESAPPDCLYFAETGHSLCGAFKAYWESHGLEFDGKPGTSYAESLALFGLPLSEPQMETNADGATVLTQWFERTRFEYHPNNPAAYQVLLGRLGAEVYGGVVQ